MACHTWPAFGFLGAQMAHKGPQTTSCLPGSVCSPAQWTLSVKVITCCVRGPGGAGGPGRGLPSGSSLSSLTFIPA